MRPLPSGGYGARARWEFVELPAMLRDDTRAVLYAPFGPPWNLSLAPRTVWMSRNIIPLLPPEQWELSEGDHARMHVLRVLYPAFARAARRSICVSQHARAALSALARIDAERIAVVPHGIEPIVERRASSEAVERVRAGSYVLHVGQAIPYRRTAELVEGYALLAARRRVPPLVLVGKARDIDAGYERRCLSMLAPLVGCGQAMVLGQVPHADVRALMGSAQTFAYPSVQEDCPNVVLEALSAGRVGVYADIAAVRELAGDAAVFVRDPRPEGLAQALERAVLDEPLRSRLPGEARARGAQFTWDRSAERLVAILDDAFSRS
jgi:glycosyltransferase involved in cell wall biosynthesis